MTKKIISLLAASLALLNPASAQTFLADSDVINNQYCPLPAGAVAFYTGYGTELGQSIASWTNRVSVVGADMVNGIHSMKVVARRTGIATDIIHWYAQDTDGNVWLVQHGSGPTPDQTQFLCMPATLDVGSTFAGLDAEQLDEFTVESLSETVSTPLHVFNNCVKGTNSDFGNHQVLYFRPNLGLVKTYLTNNTDNAGFQLASVHGITVDLTPPALTLLSPSANQHWTNNSTFTVTGKASDNAAVSAVQVSADGINWSDATSGDNFTNWTADVNLAAGTNIIRAYAIDANGNHSLTNKASMVSVLNDGPAPASPAGMTFFQTAAAAAPAF